MLAAIDKLARLTFIWIWIQELGDGKAIQTASEDANAQGFLYLFTHSWTVKKIALNESASTSFMLMWAIYISKLNKITTYSNL